MGGTFNSFQTDLWRRFERFTDKIESGKVVNFFITFQDGHILTSVCFFRNFVQKGELKREEHLEKTLFGSTERFTDLGKIHFSMVVQF